MRTSRVAWALFALTLARGQTSLAQNVDREATLTGVREVYRALDLLQDVLTNDPGPIQFKGLYTLSSNIQVNLASFRNQVKNKASRDDLYVAFDEVDRQIKSVIDLLEGAPMLTGGLRLAVRRL